MQPFFLNNSAIILYGSVSALCAAGVFIAVKLAARVFEEVMFRKLRNRIKRNPDLGDRDDVGDFVYTQGKFAVKYRVVEPNDREVKAKIKIIALKRRRWGYEEKMHYAGKVSRNFWIYRKWSFIFRPLALCCLVVVSILIYLIGFEPEESKIERVRWFIARMLKINPDAVTVGPNGEVEVRGQRKTKEGIQGEDISYNFNLADWLTFHGAGFISRTTGGQKNTETYPVQYYGNGNFSVEKDNKRIEGQYSDGQIKWAEPLGVDGVLAEKIQGDGVNRPSGKVLIEDK